MGEMEVSWPCECFQREIDLAHLQLQHHYIGPVSKLPLLPRCLWHPGLCTLPGIEDKGQQSGLIVGLHFMGSTTVQSLTGSMTVSLSREEAQCTISQEWWVHQRQQQLMCTWSIIQYRLIQIQMYIQQGAHLLLVLCIDSLLYMNYIEPPKWFSVG